MKIYRGKSFAEVYKNSLKDLLENPEYVNKPRGQKVNEIMDVSLVIEDPRLACYENPRRSTQYPYIGAELVWYFSGDRNTRFIKEYAKFWGKIENPDETANSAYGHLLFSRQNQHGMTQWDWAFSSLIKDSDTRQAVLHFNTPDHQFITNKDFVCTLYGIFHIRENKLHFSIHMRSNDAILGLPTDIAFFTMLQQQMLKQLKESSYTDKYRDLELGHYIHFDNSLHLYERNFELVKEMLDAGDFVATSLPKIGRDFIDAKGHMTQSMRELDNIIRDFTFDENKTFINFGFKDHLFDWIVDVIQKKRRTFLARDKQVMDTKEQLHEELVQREEFTEQIKRDDV